MTEPLYDLGYLGVDININPECGDMGFRVSDEVQSELLTVSIQGVVSVPIISAEDWVGTHEV